MLVAKTTLSYVKGISDKIEEAKMKSHAETKFTSFKPTEERTSKRITKRRRSLLLEEYGGTTSHTMEFDCTKVIANFELRTRRRIRESREKDEK